MAGALRIRPIIESNFHGKIVVLNRENEHTGASASSDAREAHPQELLTIKNLSKSFGQKVALDRISLDISKGEFFTIIGPSGSGKTTLLRILAGFEAPDTCDDYRLVGTSMVGVPAERRNIATVFQNYALFPHMSVGKNIEYGLKIRGFASANRRERAERALETVQLKNAYDRSIANLSGGERQRVALARAIVTEPALLLLDEPLGALDEKLRGEMQEELKEMQSSLGMTFVYVTHNQDEALSMSDRVAILHGGLLQQLDSPKVIYNRPRNAFVSAFMGAANIFECQVRAGASGSAKSVEFAGATFDLTGGMLANETGAATVSVRPENIELSLTAGANSVPGTVRHTNYRGSYQDVKVVLDDGVVLEAIDREHLDLSQGDPVHVGIDFSRASVLEIQ